MARFDPLALGAKGKFMPSRGDFGGGRFRRLEYFGAPSTSSSPTPVLPTIFVDSELGASGNDGRSASTPKDTIANAIALSPGADDRLGLAANGEWLEPIGPTVGLLHVMSYGTGKPPLLEGAVAIDAGDFTPSGHADAGGVVYEVTLSRDPAGVYVSGDTYMMWQDGEWLVRKTSVAACAAQAGTFYLAQPNALVTPSLAYVHPFGSSDPTSDGKLYERTYRSALIQMTDTDGATVEGIHVRRGMGAYGPVTAGFDTTLRRVLSAQGGKHNIIVKSGLLEDCIAFDAEVGRSVLTDGGMIPYTIYDATPAGLDFTLRRCFAILPAGRRNASQAFYNHGSSGSPAYHRTARYEQCASVRGGNLVALCQEFVIDDYVALDGIDNVLQIPNAANGALRRALIQVTTTAGNVAAVRLPTAGATAGKAIEIADCCVLEGAGLTGAPIQLQVASICDVHHNAFVSSATGRVADLQLIDAASSFSRNIVVSNRAGSTEIAALKSGMPRDFNVYVNTIGSGVFWRDTVTGTAFSLTEWQNETGQDLNSIYVTGAAVDDLFLNGMAGLNAGDFRLNPACELTFGDGSLVVGNVGPREHYDWQARAVVSGPPSAWPTFPATEDECAEYIASPSGWNFYP